MTDPYKTRRMPENHRIRNGKRVALMLDNVSRHNGHLCCEYCGEKLSADFQVDHVVPRKDGQTDPQDPYFCVVACFDCNSQKNGSWLEDVPGFPEGTAERVYDLLAERREAHLFEEGELWEASRVIYRLSWKNSKRLEYVYNWVANGDVDND